MTGIFKVGPAGVGWRGKNGQTTKIVASDVSGAVWTRIGLPFQLKLEAKNGTSYKFDGFREADVEALKKYISKGYGVEWKEEAVSHRGWNWGAVDVDGTTLKFSVDQQPSFELPLNEATQANVTKTEVSVSFNPSGEAIEDGDALAEIKFFVPNTRGDEPESVKDHVAGAEGEDEEIPEFNEELLMTPAEALANKIMDKIEGAFSFLKESRWHLYHIFRALIALFSVEHLLTFVSILLAESLFPYMFHRIIAWNGEKRETNHVGPYFAKILALSSLATLSHCLTNSSCLNIRTTSIWLDYVPVYDILMYNSPSRKCSAYCRLRAHFHVDSSWPSGSSTPPQLPFLGWQELPHRLLTHYAYLPFASNSRRYVFLRRFVGSPDPSRFYIVSFDRLLHSQQGG